MVHKPKHKVHSFRGLVGSGEEDEINLERQNLNLAYRIVKFQIMPKDPNVTLVKHVMKIYRESQSTINDSVDFTDQDLLGAATYNEAPEPQDQAGYGSIIFDNTLFSRNIYVTNFELSGGASCNYYLEIEEVPVTAATLMQLKLAVARKLSLVQ